MHCGQLENSELEFLRSTTHNFTLEVNGRKDWKQLVNCLEQRVFLKHFLLKTFGHLFCN